jgi:hypothetical protein
LGRSKGVMTQMRMETVNQELDEILNQKCRVKEKREIER